MIFAAVRTGSLEIDLCDACSELSDSGFRGEREKRARRKKISNLPEKTHCVNELVQDQQNKYSDRLRGPSSGLLFCEWQIAQENFRISTGGLTVSRHQNRFYLSSTNQ
jgi:hypothetical protein